MQPPHRGRKWLRWALGFALVAVIVAMAGVVWKTTVDTSSAETKPKPADTARAYAEAWRDGNYTRMYQLLSPHSHRVITFAAFKQAFQQAAETTTLKRISLVGATRVRRGIATTPVVANTREFAHVHQNLSLRLVPVPAGFRVLWGPQLVFPGLNAGEQLRVHTHAPFARGAIRARDGEVLASGPASNREYPQGEAFSDVTGYVKTPTSDQVAARVAKGWPAHRPFGQAGLEESLDGVLGGRPEIDLQAVSGNGSSRTLASRAGAKPQDVVTTLRIHTQHDVADALGGKYGGAVVLDPKSGAVEASVGLGMEVLQPPGSSFKTVTAAAALQSKVATLDTSYPYARFIELNGWKLHNFHKESCGGSFILAFAVSCNSVFAPVADQVGATRLVAMADNFGFNHKGTIRYPVPTSITPRVGQLDSDLALGTAGIGQGGVGATPLQMASVAATIGSKGIYRAPYIVHSPAQIADYHPGKRVLDASIATQVRTMMEAVVSEGTGASAAVPGVTVAGKTGTAEVGVKRPTDAWFIAFAPADHPTVAVAVLVAGGGVGGEVAAPIAGQILRDTLG